MSAQEAHLTVSVKNMAGTVLTIPITENMSILQVKEIISENNSDANNENIQLIVINNNGKHIVLGNNLLVSPCEMFLFVNPNLTILANYIVTIENFIGYLNKERREKCDLDFLLYIQYDTPEYVSKRNGKETLLRKWMNELRAYYMDLENFDPEKLKTNLMQTCKHIHSFAWDCLNRNEYRMKTDCEHDNLYRNTMKRLDYIKGVKEAIANGLDLPMYAPYI